MSTPETGPHKTCSKCGQLKALTAFYRKSANCKPCDIKRVRALNVKDPAAYLLRQARSRAERSGLEFDLQRSDIHVPTHCPVLGTPLRMHARGRHDDTPSLDRIDSTRGYVRGNVRVISWRMNNLKRDLTLDEVRRLAEYMENSKCPA